MHGTDGIRAAGGGHVKLWAFLFSASSGLDLLSRHVGFCLNELWDEEHKEINSEDLKSWEIMKQVFGKILAIDGNDR